MGHYERYCHNGKKVAENTHSRTKMIKPTNTPAETREYDAIECNIFVVEVTKRFKALKQSMHEGNCAT